MDVRCGVGHTDSGKAWAMAAGGCGELLDLIKAYRCLDCSRRFHADCLARHFGRAGYEQSTSPVGGESA